MSLNTGWIRSTCLPCVLATTLIPPAAAAQARDASGGPPLGEGVRVLGPVTPGVPMAGTFTNALVVNFRPMVFYSFPCTPGQAVQVAVTSDFDNVSTIIDANREPVAYNDFPSSRSTRLRWTCPDARVYHIGTANYVGGVDGRFTMLVTVQGGAAAAQQVQEQRQATPQVQEQRQPTPQRTQPASPVFQVGSDGRSNYAGWWEAQPGATVTGTLADAAGRYNDRPYQWYVFQCQTNRGIRVTIRSAFDNILTILTLGGEFQHGNNDAEGTNAGAYWICPDNGQYLIGVGALNAGTGAGPYEMTVR